LFVDRKLTRKPFCRSYLIDPDARSLITHGHESLVGYNVQSVVDDANKLIVHTEVTNENDINALGQLVEDTHELLALEPNAEILTDKGYYNAAELQKVRDLGHNTFVAERRHGANNKEGNYSPSSFCYDDAQDAYVCPAGELLKTTGKLHTRSGSSHRFKTYRGSRAVCGKCPIREKCLTAKSQTINHARTITRLEHAAAIAANRDNLYNNPGVYQQRHDTKLHHVVAA
jgi:hypothetical protein